MKQRLIATTALAVVVLAAPAWAVFSGTDFDDVPPGHPHHAAVHFVTGPGTGWFQGYEDGTFRPDDLMTDRQISKVVRRVLPDVSRGEMAELLTAYYHTISPRVWEGMDEPDEDPQVNVYTQAGVVVIEALLHTDRRAELADGTVYYELWQNGHTGGNHFRLPRSHEPGGFRTEIPCGLLHPDTAIRVVVAEQGRTHSVESGIAAVC